MTFEICAIEIGVTSWWECTTYDWWHFDLKLTRISYMCFRPKAMTLAKDENDKWVKTDDVHQVLIRQLQFCIDDFFATYGKKISMG